MRGVRDLRRGGRVLPVSVFLWPRAGATIGQHDGHGLLQLPLTIGRNALAVADVEHSKGSERPLAPGGNELGSQIGELGAARYAEPAKLWARGK